MAEPTDVLYGLLSTVRNFVVFYDNSLLIIGNINQKNIFGTAVFPIQCI